MSLLTPPPPLTRAAAHYIEIVEPDPDHCPSAALPPEGNVKLRNYRLLSENLRAYTPTGDIHTSPTKGKLVARFDVCATISPPRARILELLRPEDPGRAALEAIVRPAPRRLQRPLDDDARRFLQRALLSPSPQGLSAAATPEPHAPATPEPHAPATPEPEPAQPRSSRSPSPADGSLESSKERSLADELREAEEDERSGGSIRRDMWREFRVQSEGAQDACERERLGKLALSVEEDEEAEAPVGAELGAAARRLDALLAESRGLHAELAGLRADLQVLARRVRRDV